MAELKEVSRAKSDGNQAMKETAALAERAEHPAHRSPSPALRPISPMSFLRRYAAEMDRMFEEFGIGHGLHVPPFLTRGHELLRREAGIVEAEWSPKVDVKEQDGRLLVRADLPGLSKDDIKVELTDETITIRGERKQEKKEEREGYSYSECSYGRFLRTIPLPDGADTTKVTAEFHNGVLEIGIPTPQRAEPQARHVEVRERK